MRHTQNARISVGAASRISGHTHSISIIYVAYQNSGFLNGGNPPPSSPPGVLAHESLPNDLHARLPNIAASGSAVITPPPHRTRATWQMAAGDFPRSHLV